MPSGVAAVSCDLKSGARWSRAASKPSSRRCATFSGPPAMPTARAPAGGGDDHRLARLGPADLGQPGVGGEPRHAEHAERGRDRRLAGVELAQPLRGLQAVLLPAGVGEHDVTG
jgi:hypothetical protein